MPKSVIDQERRTNPFIWGAAIICAIVTVVMIIVGIIVIISYFIIHPKTPSISVSYANLDRIYYDQMGNLQVQITMVIKAKNDNAKTHARFYDIGLIVGFSGMEIAKLENKPFDVEKNNSVEFTYLVNSRPIPLKKLQGDFVQSSFRKQVIQFDLTGKAKTKWRVWVIGSVKLLLNIDCNLQFFVPNGSATPYSESHYCSSKSS